MPCVFFVLAMDLLDFLSAARLPLNIKIRMPAPPPALDGDPVLSAAQGEAAAAVVSCHRVKGLYAY